jgi:hypothetical protein
VHGLSKMKTWKSPGRASRYFARELRDLAGEIAHDKKADPKVKSAAELYANVAKSYLAALRT